MHFGLRTSEVTPQRDIRSEPDSPSSLKTLLSAPGPLSIITLVETCLREAHHQHASDIHIEPNEHAIRVRFRIDGMLCDIVTLPRTIHSEIISRIKVLSHLRTDEHQAAQDGRFRATFATTAVDIRVSIAPTHHGENAVLRLLTEHATPRTLSTLGLHENDQAKIERAVACQSGMILATGPTGSGKTSTLYTLLKLLNHSEISIVTIEDPIEYAVAGVTQMQINPRSNLTFANGLRTVLRQDPNVIMVGEIRDAETANIAINTALTGHLLLSTLHTNDAATTLPRLLDMGVDAYLVASTINIAIGQRLVRKICLHCRTKHTPTEAETRHLKLSSHTTTEKYENVPNKFFHGAGCPACNHSGYAGRIGIYEVLVVSPTIREAILQRASAATIHTIAQSEGLTSMFEDGLRKAAKGDTTIAEVLRVVGTPIS
ncbi:GspE/PulE family protein [Patescibacteria group bacterium]|nr:GspE/PulE family protein [Patescibacteria group bacterium]